MCEHEFADLKAADYGLHSQVVIMQLCAGQVPGQEICPAQVPVAPPATSASAGSSKFRKVTFFISSFLSFFIFSPRNEKGHEYQAILITARQRVKTRLSPILC